MQIATFVISIIAVLVAGVAALAAQRSASAAERAAARDPWEIENVGTNDRWLKNTSRRTAFGVTMSTPGDQPAVRLGDVPVNEVIHAGARRRLSIGIGIGKPMMPSVVVTWRESKDGAELEWKSGL